MIHGLIVNYILPVIHGLIVSYTLSVIHGLIVSYTLPVIHGLIVSYTWPYKWIISLNMAGIETWDVSFVSSSGSGSLGDELLDFLIRLSKKKLEGFVKLGITIFNSDNLEVNHALGIAWIY